MKMPRAPKPFSMKAPSVKAPSAKGRSKEAMKAMPPEPKLPKMGPMNRIGPQNGMMTRGKPAAFRKGGKACS